MLCHPPSHPPSSPHTVSVCEYNVCVIDDTTNSVSKHWQPSYLLSDSGRRLVSTAAAPLHLSLSISLTASLPSALLLSQKLNTHTVYCHVWWLIILISCGATKNYINYWSTFNNNLGWISFLHSLQIYLYIPNLRWHICSVCLFYK